MASNTPTPIGPVKDPAKAGLSAEQIRLINRLVVALIVAFFAFLIFLMVAGAVAAWQSWVMS